MKEFRNIDGTYTSPKNGKIYKSEKALRAHLSFKPSKSQENWQEINKKKIQCNFCKDDISITNIGKHEDSCYLNPKNVTLCKVCNNPVKNYKNSKGTCSYSCSNRFFRKLRNRPENYTRYTAICFHFHEKKCVVCGEENIVAVHHYDEDHNNNRPENLVPLCPTHHQYMHSRYKKDILFIVEKYIEYFKNQSVA